MNIQVQNTSSGVKATLSGFSATEIKSKIEACQEGSCECNCDSGVMERISGIELQENRDTLELCVNGDVDAQTLAPMMQSCLIGEAQ
ncbi:MAG: hypothetical protein JXK05_02920 [Campylobacterales bacterium]|nr:hypothetical protein [Campylobacterales bacterium]